jgi:hypothetical protein
MLKKIILFTISIICIISIKLGYGQKSTISDTVKIQETITDFLNWYKLNEIENPTTEQSPEPDTIINAETSIIEWNQIDTMMTVRINMEAVEVHLHDLRSSTYLSNSFINDLRAYYQKIANEVKRIKPSPVSEGIFAIPGLNCDVIFGCEPEDVLDHIKEGKFTKIYIVSNKAIVRFSVGRYVNKIITLTKVADKWMIDHFAYDYSKI